jgi:hypothetical protein
MTNAEHDRNERWVSVRMYSHTIVVYFYIRIPKNLVNVGSSRHKLPRHRKNCVGDTDPSGQNWSDTVCRRRHVATCRRHFQLSTAAAAAAAAAAVAVAIAAVKLTVIHCR